MTELEKARTKLAAAESAVADARARLATAEGDTDPETIGASRKTARDLATKVTDLEAVTEAWRTKVVTAEKDEKRVRLGALVKEADATSVRAALGPLAAERAKLMRRLEEITGEAQMAIARQGLLCADAESLAKEIGEPVAVERLPPRWFDALCMVTRALNGTKVPNLLLHVLVSTGYIESEFLFHQFVADAKAAGLEEAEIVAGAIDGSLRGRMTDASAAKAQADTAARTARAATEKEYEAASAEFPWSFPKAATAAQRARLDAAEEAYLGAARAKSLREQRGAPGAINEGMI